jgi:hypothetical protein
MTLKKLCYVLDANRYVLVNGIAEPLSLALVCTVMITKNNKEK